jgi:hypothetical protein
MLKRISVHGNVMVVIVGINEVFVFVRENIRRAKGGFWKSNFFGMIFPVQVFIVEAKASAFFESEV